MGVSSLRNPVVIRISLAYVYDLAVQLEPLGTLPQVDTPYSEVFMHILNAKFALDRFDTSVFRPYIRSSVALLGQLRTAIDEEAAKTDFDRVLTQYDLYKIRYTFQQFKIVLLAELTVLNTYFVTQKGGFDTLSLLSWGENCFPLELMSKVPEAIVDVREATRSLAYELPTAVGFHVFRAIESVLRRYHSHVTGGGAPPKVRNIGVYLESLKLLNKGNPKVRASLKQITDLHRNPLIPDSSGNRDDIGGGCKHNRNRAKRYFCNAYRDTRRTTDNSHTSISATAIIPP